MNGTAGIGIGAGKRTGSGGRALDCLTMKKSDLPAAGIQTVVWWSAGTEWLLSLSVIRGAESEKARRGGDGSFNGCRVLGA